MTKQIRHIGTTIIVLSSVFFMVGCASLSHQSTEEESPIPREMKSFVHSAAQLVAREGESAFPDFRNRDKKWFDDNRYIFVWGDDGIRYVYPPDPSQEGINIVALKDARGKPIGKNIMEAVSGTQQMGWVYYEWPKPGEIFPSLKISWVEGVQAPGGKDYIVGSGTYVDEPTMALTRHIVDAGAVKLAKCGKAAFKEFRDPAGPFVFGDIYLFVYDMKATNLFNYATPSIEGTSLWNYKDPKGFYLIRRFLEETEHAKSAEVSYAWPKPGETELSQKVAYVRRVQTPDGEMLIGAGIYKN